MVAGDRARHPACMARRLSIASLWFVAFLCLHELAWSVFGSPRILGLAIGGLAAAFILVDPWHLATPASTVRQVSSRLHADLDPR